LAEQGVKPQGGVKYEGAGGKLSASDEAVNTVVGATERVWNKTLDWGGDHPFLFALLVLLGMFGFFVRQKAKVQLADLRGQYDLRREEIRAQQPSLPLPAPEKPRELNHDPQ